MCIRDSKRPISNLSFFHSRWSPFLKTFNELEQTKSSSKAFQILTILSEKKCWRKSVLFRLYFNLNECPPSKCWVKVQTAANFSSRSHSAVFSYSVVPRLPHWLLQCDRYKSIDIEVLISISILLRQSIDIGIDDTFKAGVVSNISQCQIALICAIASAQSRKVSCATVYLIFISLLTLCLGS